MKKWIVWCVLLAGILYSPCTGEAAIRKKKSVKEEKVEPSEYDKLFKGKRYESAVGEFVAVHKMEGKLYIEYPLRLFGRELLLASTTTSSTDHSVCTNGYKENTPLHIRFTLKDGFVQLRKINAWIATDSDRAEVDQAIRQNFNDPVVEAYKVLAYTPDSLAVVFEMTGMFLNEEPELSPIPQESGAMKVTAVYESNLSSIQGVKAFKDNMSVKSQLNYTYTVARDRLALVKDQPLTVEVTRTLLLLPERKMKPRLSDVRMGTFLTMKRYLSENGEPVEKYSYANRWRLEPKDREAYLRGELTEPEQPIVFYLDPLFPETWKKPIREGVLRWNKAFEKIGYRDVMQVRDFPADDTSFDPDNLKYSCIRYVPAAVANAMGPSWVDPSTGEILNASVLIYNDVVQMIKSWRFIQTAQVDPSVRGKELPESVLDESLTYVVSHEIGHCLGLMHNMAASAAYPVDSLRSVSFTRKYGTTPSIMDYARFNYVAQPGDEGVKLTPPDLGVYDEFAIRWLYTSFEASATLWDEAKTLETWVDEKADDPMYRYGRQQVMGRYDPSALEEDLGDDPLKAGEYGIRNLKYILPHLNEWITNDPSAGYRQQLYDQMTSQYYRYIRNVMYNIGGGYLSDAKEDSRFKRHQSVSREMQKASVEWVLTQLKNATWIDDPKVSRKLPLGVSPSVTLVENLGKQLFLLYKQVTLSASLSDDPYTVEEYFDDLYREVWESAIQNRRLTTADMILQSQSLASLGEQVKTIGGKRVGLSLADIYCYGLDPTGMTERYISSLRTLEKDQVAFGSGYGWQRVIDTEVLEETPAYYLEMLIKVKNLLESRMETFAVEDRPHYEAMLFAMKQALGKQAQKN